jgi:hypothetical protein
VRGTSPSESSLSSSPPLPVSPSPDASLTPDSRFLTPAFPDPLADPFVDVLSGESLRAKPPIRIPNDGPGGKTADGYGGSAGGGGGPEKVSGTNGTAGCPHWG